MNTSKFLERALSQNDMKIQYAADLHLELSGNSRWIKHHPLAVSGDVLILAGDIIYLGDDGGLKHPFWDWCADNFEQTTRRLQRKSERAYHIPKMSFMRQSVGNAKAITEQPTRLRFLLMQKSLWQR